MKELDKLLSRCRAMFSGNFARDSVTHNLPPKGKLTQVVYTSIAIEPFSEPDLRKLLVHARARNQSLEVGGILLYHKGSFMQVLEGPEAAVDAVFSSIEDDPGHSRIKLLVRTPVVRREYSDWSMGFIDLSRLAGFLDGYVDFETATPLQALSSDAAARLLSLFPAGEWRLRVGS